MECWYLVYCKPKQESRARANLLAQGIEAFYPVINQSKTTSSKVLSQPLFPRYLFVSLDPELSAFSVVKNTRGISDFVRYGANLQLVPASLVSQLMQSKQEFGVCELNMGDAVIVQDGCYKNIQALYQEPDGEKRSVLLIKLLNQSIEITIANSAIMKL
ncbi:transcription/translation regulatory transformer protein RfaH [Pseudoalteromonas piscicida]|uniref:Transcription/translation regulatory transformer protein RfaH n=1 Tax=Pseudoalteromonas piscicida TaxID=43662 RepID=A0A2A5JW37_PSEO7|nr:transcription/translation regulatory transformer protein RfaH [Pseudoalteromonas piscicida]PCK33620.1 transcription/translation regulatory transformer protein RfaH [Pseudoalteromonas piscicida]